ncbi:MAG: hypothetical protein KatS3mg129_0646 [Leptospiraceae bacterium]|nr:MAG: hypothetical protein KatS3mg129_0646 [Leptospiraceae bacterium]
MKSYERLKYLDDVTIEHPSLNLKNNTLNDEEKEILLYLWKRRKPSPGYNRSYYAEFPDGTKVIIEYNFVREIIKIELFPVDEHRHYYVMIQRGTILQEREFQSNRPVSLYSRIGKYKKFFSYLFDEQVLKTIGGCYEIPLKSKHPYGTSDFNTLQFKQRFNKFKPKKFWIRLKEYLEQKEKKQKQYKGFKKLLYRLPADLFDTFIIIYLFRLFYTGEITAIAFSLYSIFYSLLAGFIDIYWRRRNPIVIKTLLLSLPGIIIFWFRYQLDLWGIQEPAHHYLHVLYYLLKQKLGIT